MKKVVYFLGAGFSRPLGIPAMSDFISKSKDLYLSDINKYGHFNNVFNDMNRLNNIKNYYQADLFNIEEVLSLFEMEDQLGGKRSSKKFIKYISDVINYYTPDLEASKYKLVPTNFISGVLNDSKLVPYAVFILSLLNIKISKVVTHNPGRDDTNFVLEKTPTFDSLYSVVSLNYDSVIEDFLSHYNICLNLPLDFSFDSQTAEGTILVRRHSRLLKLHGDAKSNEIILPTWSKKISKKFQGDWASAYSVLSNATDIRILGYSLPDSDSYVRYLFKSAIIDSFNLKNIEVICLDPTGDVKKKYDEFIKFKNYSFFNVNIEEYLKAIYDVFLPDHQHKGFIDAKLTKIEEGHKKFIELIANKK